MNEQITVEKILKEAKGRYSVVFKNSESKSIAILYRNRAEYYGGYNKKFISFSGNDYDFYAEVEMLRGSGYKQVLYNKEEVE